MELEDFYGGMWACDRRFIKDEAPGLEQSDQGRSCGPCLASTHIRVASEVSVAAHSSRAVQHCTVLLLSTRVALNAGQDSWIDGAREQASSVKQTREKKKEKKKKERGKEEEKQVGHLSS